MNERVCYNTGTDNLKDFGQLDTVEFDTPVIILLALVKKAQDRLDKEWLASLPKEVQVSKQDFARHKRMGHLACSIYDASRATSKAKWAQLMKIREEDIVGTNFAEEDDSRHCPKFLVLLDHESKSVVLVVRGTFSVTDVFIDIVCDDEEFLGGHAHRGILRGARAVLDSAGVYIKDALADHPGYRFCVTGHSLGAATAELIAMELICGDEKEEVVGAGTDVSCVALAPPPVFRPDDDEDRGVLDRVSGRIAIYVNGQDCVPRASLASAARLVATLRAVDALPLSKTQQFLMLASEFAPSSPSSSSATDALVSALSGREVTPDETEANLRLLEDTVSGVRQEKFPFLEHPAPIHYLYPKVGSASPSSLDEETSSSPSISSFLPFSSGSSKLDYLVVKQSSHTFSRELTVLERMVLDHLEWCYRSAFDGVSLKEEDEK